jgi:threonine dehydratase
MGLEILRESETLDGDLDMIFVSIGGGGMIAGIAAVVKALNPKIQVIGVEPAGANAMCQSLVRGERVVLSKVDAFADGVAIKLPGAEPFRLCRELLDGVVMVDNGAIATALKDVFNETRTILEPAGAVALAGAKAYLQYYGLKGKRVVAVTSGSNMNFDRLRLVSELVDIGSVETMLAATIPEQKGAIVQLLEMASGPDGTPFDVTEFEFRRRSFDAGRGGTARVLLGLGVSPGTKACRAMMDKFAQTEGYAITDISDMDLAQTHLRHMVGGPALQSDGAPVQDERIFKVDYREQVGMLRKLLTPLSPRWDVTLLHFRKTGNRFATALLGLRIPDDEASSACAFCCFVTCGGVWCWACASPTTRWVAVIGGCMLPDSPLVLMQLVHNANSIYVSKEPLTLSASNSDLQMEEFEATLEQFRSTTSLPPSGLTSLQICSLLAIQTDGGV